jgi:hypothetical protein
MLEIVTTSLTPPEPPCFCIVDRPSLSSWEWSLDGEHWSDTSAVHGSHYPHLAEAPHIFLKPKHTEKKNNVRLYDFGVILLGRVVISVAGGSAPRLNVGESLAEALSEVTEHCEQSTEVVQGEEGTTWESVHLLAFRFVCVELQEEQLVEVSCRAQYHPVQYRGAFCASDHILSKVWMNAAYTARLCMHDFLIDGIKRDRLPWAGDLCVSLLANAYTFCDGDIVRRQSLAVLGRLFITAQGNITGIVDYSLWWFLHRIFFNSTLMTKITSVGSGLAF